MLHFARSLPRLHRWVGRWLPHRMLQRARSLRSHWRPAPPWLGRGYAAWLASREPGAAELAAQRTHRFDFRPTISLVIPDANVPGRDRSASEESIAAQTYPHWRITHDVNEAEGEFIAFLAAGDTLAPFALFDVAMRLADVPDLDLVYSDEDAIDDLGQRGDPRFKPDWSPETLLGFDYVGDFTVVRTSLARELGGWRREAGSAERHDFMLRLAERTGSVAHIPKILYHRRQRTKPPEEINGGATADAIERRGWFGEVAVDARGGFEIALRCAARPRVSVIIPNRDQPAMLRRAVEAVRAGGHEPYEIVVVENGSRDSRTFDLYRELERRGDLRVVTWDRPFNYSAVNNHGVAHSSGELLLFLNNDVGAATEDWLARMAGWAMLRDIGAVGVTLLFPNDSVQHAGVAVGTDGIPRHVDSRTSKDYPRRNVSAVTAACSMMRRDVFDRAGGFDERFALNFNDVDLCFKVRRLGLRIVVLPDVALHHHESATRGSHFKPGAREQLERELSLFRAAWCPGEGTLDPYFGLNAEAS